MAKGKGNARQKSCGRGRENGQKTLGKERARIDKQSGGRESGSMD